MGRTTAITYGVIFGILLDIFISRKIGITSIMLATTGFLADLFDKNFSKDNRITVMAMVGLSTVIYEVGTYMLSYLILNINVEILAFTKILLVETIYNIILTIIIYPLMQLTGYDVEEEYKGTKILTRYF